MKKIILMITIISFFSISSINTKLALAQGNAPSEGDFNSWIQDTVPNFAGGTVGDIVSALIPYIFGIAGFALLIFLVLGGYQIMISQGDPKQMAAGREKITYAIIGYIIMFVAYFITLLVAEVLDIEKLRNIF
jgi:hypothetical protein